MNLKKSRSQSSASPTSPKSPSGKNAFNYRLNAFTVMDITPADQELLEELRGRIKYELELVPAYDEDLSLMRWLVGWDRKVDVVVPKIRFSLRAIHALGLNKEDFSTLEKVTEYCDNVSVPLQYLPGSLVGFDKDGNVLSLQMVGRLDASGLMPCTRNSDLYRMRIAESEGVMQIIRAQEKKLGRQLGTSVIFDLEGMSTSMLDVAAIKVITTMLQQLQEMFPDVLRKIFIINAPSFIQMLWAMISPCLAKQTQQKIEFLGDNWKERLREAIGEEVLFEHWGGTREADNEYGFVRTGGKVPASLKYDPANNMPADKLTRLNVPARSTTFVSVTVEGPVDEDRKIRWWWTLESGDVTFGIFRASEGHETVAEHEDDYMVQPKFRLQTQFVPEEGEASAAEPGVYKLVFDNTHGKIWAKKVNYFVEIC